MTKRQYNRIIKLLSKALDILLQSEVKHNHKEYVYTKDKIKSCLKTIKRNDIQWVEGVYYYIDNRHPFIFV